MTQTDILTIELMASIQILAATQEKTKVKLEALAKEIDNTETVSQTNINYYI